MLAAGELLLPLALLSHCHIFKPVGRSVGQMTWPYGPEVEYPCLKVFISYFSGKLQPYISEPPKSSPSLFFKITCSVNALQQPVAAKYVCKKSHNFWTKMKIPSSPLSLKHKLLMTLLGSNPQLMWQILSSLCLLNASPQPFNTSVFCQQIHGQLAHMHAPICANH